ncbi:MAG: ethylbenzene dehydrogenase-related protein [Pseudomonadota bacterium]
MEKSKYFIILSIVLLLIGCAFAQTLPNDYSISTKENLLAKKINTPQPGEYLTIVKPERPAKTFFLMSRFIQKAPIIDGRVDNAIWQKTPSVTVLDYASQRPITIQSVHTKNKIFLLVRYPDAAPSVTHESLTWDYNEGIYKQANDREDVCIIKWSMVGNNINLSLQNPVPHKADIWFWKAKRTNPVGYADDKSQLLSDTPVPQSNPVKSPNNTTYYLQRQGDSGTPAYDEQFVFEYRGDVIDKFHPLQPTGSRADVRANGVWDNGFWTIEFERNLQTEHTDDVLFQIGKSYLLGISLYEITNAGIRPELSQPLYKAGDIYDHILLTIK